jgi:hypothetical protein
MNESSNRLRLREQWFHDDAGTVARLYERGGQQ